MTQKQCWSCFLSIKRKKVAISGHRHETTTPLQSDASLLFPQSCCCNISSFIDSFSSWFDDPLSLLILSGLLLFVYISFISWKNSRCDHSSFFLLFFLFLSLNSLCLSVFSLHQVCFLPFFFLSVSLSLLNLSLILNISSF